MRDERVAWVNALSKLIDGYAGDTPRHQTGRWQWVLGDPCFRFKRALSEEYPHALPREGLFDRVLSISYIARLPETKKLKLRAKIDDILRENGLGGGAGITLPYVSRLYLLTRR